MANNMTFLSRAAEKTGFQRSFYIENNAPDHSDDVLLIHFFGDFRSEFILSSFLAKRLKEQTKKYLIVCSWKGWKSLFPYADEFWSPKNGNEELFTGAGSFFNTSERYVIYRRALNQYFANVMGFEEISRYFQNGFTADFVKMFSSLTMTLPEVRVSDIEYDPQRVFIMPLKSVRTWYQGELVHRYVSPRFWTSLLKHFDDCNMKYLVFENWMTHDLDVKDAKREIDMGSALSTMRACGIVLDVFSGLSRIAGLARRRALCLDERARHYAENDGIFDETMDLTYIFSHASLVDERAERDWKSNIFDGMISKLEDMFSNNIDDERRHLLEEDREIPWEAIRRRRINRRIPRYLAKRREVNDL